jgi:hypothetical protein
MKEEGGRRMEDEKIKSMGRNKRIRQAGQRNGRGGPEGEGSVWREGKKEGEGARTRTGEEVEGSKGGKRRQVDIDFQK